MKIRRTVFPSIGVLIMSAALSASASATDAKTAVENVISALENRDIVKLEFLFAESGTVEAPFQPTGDASDAAIQRYSGRAQSMAYYRGVFERIRKVSFANATITPAGDRVAFLEGVGAMELPSGSPYSNRYIVRFETDDAGKVTLMREYFNPVTAAIAFGRPLGPQSK